MTIVNAKKSTLLILILSSFVFSGCAHTEKKLDEKVAAEPEIKSREQLRQDAIRRIQTAPGLTEGQRSQLLQLRAATQKSFDEIREDTYKLEEALVQDVITTKNYNRSEVYSIQKRMRKLADKRLTILSAAVDGASKILGRPTDAERELMINEMIFEAHHERD